jgi:cell division septation protein DedD
VSEFTHDTAEDGFHEIQLSGKQLVFLFIVTTTVIVVVFLCGVKVGRGARAAQGDEPEPSALSATASPDPQAVPQTVEPRPTEPPPPAAEEPDKLTYSGVLKGKEPGEATLKPEEDVKAAPAPAPEPKPKAVAPVPPPAAPVSADTAGIPTAGRPGAWAIQVIATRDRNMATSIVKRLGGKGYPAFLVNPPAGKDPGFYKVHVGRYKDRGEAERVSQRIKKEKQFQSWITR